MKKIILNGCSWVAGDEIAWDLFCKEFNLIDEDYNTFGERHKHDRVKISLIHHYRDKWRRKHNQGGMLSKLLNTQVDDLAIDGNSNDSIALTTISHIMQIPIEERKEYHVIIGWTILERILYYLDYYWENCRPADYERTENNWPRWKNRFLGLVEQTDDDWFLNYYKNVILLESFLKSNQMTYTFYRSIGNGNQYVKQDSSEYNLFFNKKNPGDRNQFIQIFNLNAESIDSNSWLTFFEEDKNRPLLGHSWTTYMGRNYGTTFWVTPTNRHPHRRFTEMLANKIVDHLRDRSLL